MRRWALAMTSLVLATGVAAVVGVGPAWAISFDTVDWASDAAVDGTGTGTLPGVTVNYTTVVAGNAGVMVGVNWNTSLATDGAVGTGVTFLEGGVLGVVAASAPQTITFSAPVVHPIMFMNFADAGTSMDFGPFPVTLLDSNNASLAGSVVTFTGGNTFNDGAAVRITGTFGPGTPLTATYNNTTGIFQSMAFTVAVPVAPPETTPPRCFVAGVTAGPPKQMHVSVQDTGSGLQAITNVVIVNGTPTIPTFTPGTTSPIIVTATKTDPARPTTWSFDAVDVAGNVKHCS